MVVDKVQERDSEGAAKEDCGASDEHEVAEEAEHEDVERL